MIPQGFRPSGSWFETILSALVIVVALAFLTFMYARTGTGHFGSYLLTVRLPSAAGLDVGKDVRLGGVKVGSISYLSIDPKDYSAIVEVSVRDDLVFPVDTTASVSSTAMGEVYLVITPGHSHHMISPGAVFGRPQKGGLPTAGT